MTANDSRQSVPGISSGVIAAERADRRSISVHFVRAVLKHTVSAGVDPLRLLRRQRIPPRLLKEAQARVGLQQFADLATQTMRAMGDESLGYAEKPMRLGTWDMMCHAVINAANLGQALHRYCRFYQLFEGGMPVFLDMDEKNAMVRVGDSATARGAYFAELSLFNTHRFASWLVEEDLPLRSVCFKLPASAPPAEYRLMFLASPVQFECQENCMIFSASLLHKPVTQTPQSLARYLRHPMLVMLSTLYRHSWTTRVREKLRADLVHLPELNDVSSALDMHPQTLRRRLAKEGTTFKQLKSDIRRDTALHYLGKRALSVEEVAYRAGFSEASAFIRAFKGWTGLTPYAYRKGL